MTDDPTTTPEPPEVPTPGPDETDAPDADAADAPEEAPVTDPVPEG